MLHKITILSHCVVLFKLLNYLIYYSEPKLAFCSLYGDSLVIFSIWKPRLTIFPSQFFPSHLSSTALCNGTENFIKCPKEALNWQTRKFRCMEEILTYNPDVVCLQEIDHFKDFFQPLMRQIGYAGSFNPKPDSPCLDCLHNVGPDGCALFYKEDRFDLLDQSLPILEADRRGSVYYTNQVAVLNKLQLRSQEAGKMRPFLVGTTHLKAKPGWESLRYKQGRNFMDIAKTMSNGCPIIVGGDFNAEPVEAVYRLFENEFVSAYKSAGGLNQEPPYTTWKIRPRGEMCHTIDYIWHSKDSIQPVTLLQFPSGDEIGENRLPSWSYPSDHFSLVCDFVIRP